MFNEKRVPNFQKFSNQSDFFRTVSSSKKSKIPKYLSNCVLDSDFTVSGLICKNKCGIDGLFNGRNWCYTNLNSWDYCTPYHYGKITYFRE